MAADPKLVVALEARFDRFEKQLKAAGLVADREFSKIEESARTRLGTNFLAGVFQGMGQEFFRQFNPALIIQKVLEVGKALADLGDTAKRVGLDAERLQEIKFAANVEGIDDAKFLKDVESLSDSINKAARSETELTHLLEVNNEKIKNRKGQVIGTNEALDLAAKLIQRAANEFDKIDIARKFGLPKEWVKLLEEGPDAFNRMTSAARQTGVVLTNDVILKAQEFDKEWNKAVTSFAANMKAGIASILPDMTNLINKGIEFANVISDKARAVAIAVKFRDQGVDALSGEEARFIAQRFRSQGDQPSRELLNRIERADEEAREGRGRFPKGSLAAAAGGKTTTNPVGTGAGGGSERDAFDREVDRLEKHAALMEADAAAIGKTTEQKERFRAEAALIEAILRGEVEMTDQVIDRYGKVADKIEDVARKSRLAKDAFEGMNTALKFGGNELVNVIDRMTQKGAKFGDIMADVLRNISKQMLQAAITGEGAFAKLFGLNSGVPGGVGGILGMLFGGAKTPGNASGTDNWRGGPTWVGEKGPEIVNVPRGAQIVPNDIARNMGGGVSVSMGSTVLNINGNADAVTVRQLQEVLATRDRQLPFKVAAAVKTNYFHSR